MAFLETIPARPYQSVSFHKRHFTSIDRIQAHLSASFERLNRPNNAKSHHNRARNANDHGSVKILHARGSP
jgi:hypothetical protein